MREELLQEKKQHLQSFCQPFWENRGNMARPSCLDSLPGTPSIFTTQFVLRTMSTVFDRRPAHPGGVDPTFHSTGVRGKADWELLPGGRTRGETSSNVHFFMCETYVSCVSHESGVHFFGFGSVFLCFSLVLVVCLSGGSTYLYVYRSVSGF